MYVMSYNLLYVEQNKTGGDVMNTDFPRIITLLRKERGISQKKAASDLGISQGLLSHYEKGIRECGLEFIVKTADYYSVSCDYLLGRSPEPAGKTISYEDIPENDPNQKERISAGEVMASFNKKLVINAVTVLFSLTSKTKSSTLLKEVSSYLMLAVYKMFRIVYSSNSKNNRQFFTVPEITVCGESNAAMALCEARALAAAKGEIIGSGDTAKESDDTVITSGSLTDEYAGMASSLLNVVKNSEACIRMIGNDD